MEQTIAYNNTGTTKTSTNVLDLQVKMAEHILAQYDFNSRNDIRDILNETKSGAWKKSTVQKTLTMVFTKV
ncbi:hypothetical protein ACFLVU_00210 [Chloroflexota bacterium]